MGCSGVEKMIVLWSAPLVAQEAQPTFTYPSTPAGFPPVYPSHVVDGGGGTLVTIPPMVNDNDPLMLSGFA